MDKDRSVDGPFARHKTLEGPGGRPFAMVWGNQKTGCLFRGETARARISNY